MPDDLGFTSPNPDESRLWLVDGETLYHMDICFPDDIYQGLQLGIKEYWQALMIFTDQTLKEAQLEAVETTDEL